MQKGTNEDIIGFENQTLLNNWPTQQRRFFLKIYSSFMIAEINSQNIIYVLERNVCATFALYYFCLITHFSFLNVTNSAATMFCVL